ncbi:SRPBCC family protein [Mucilaginibacter sp. AW1-3]
MATNITVEATVNAPIGRVWEYWNEPEHIKNWAFASDDWHCPASENDLRKGGRYSSTMAAKDGSFSFDFWGIYDDIEVEEYIASTLGDGRKVTVKFTSEDGKSTRIVQTFEAEETNPIEMQQGGWQAILNNFKKYTEGGA